MSRSEGFQQSDSDRLRAIFKTRSLGNLRRIKRSRERHFKLSENNTLTVVVIHGCSMGCTSCARSKTDHGTMDPALLDRVFAYSSRHFNSISLTGGEPTECIDLIRSVAQNYEDLRVNITTHGEGFSQAVLDAIASCPGIYPTISLNGLGGVHDGSRHPGSFDNVMKGIEMLRERSIPFGVLTMAHRLNVGQILSGEFVDFVDYIGACTLGIFQYYPLAGSSSDHDRLCLTSKEMDDTIKYRNWLAAHNKYSFQYAEAQLTTTRCNRELQVLLDGSVSYCPFSVWGFDRVQTGDSDDEIRRKLDSYRNEWESLTAASPSHCPLQCNTKGYVEFFTRNGTELFPPCGIMDTGSSIHKHYCAMAQESEMLTP